MYFVAAMMLIEGEMQCTHTTPQTGAVRAVLGPPKDCLPLDKPRMGYAGILLTLGQVGCYSTINRSLCRGFGRKRLDPRLFQGQGCMPRNIESSENDIT